ncbi:ubiquitin-like domain-containing protein CIP73 isoform X1 [Ziziphus jujuba]|uniref:Ubiquitin-like domain-containing protein CIP73 isoform X1 n=1 Tax=Ziziphus jujuba TaxID=326968 RepID=A0A6P3ZVY8_ZIZJJ|nr:ubiquitin-like domain-containing protein CIP73 isoform X1 [Ziziphus jujuba]
MADQHSGEGSSTSNMESSDATVQIKIKTLDSQIYNFEVDKNMPVSLFKEKIENETGVPVGRQRLIFRGKVLKDNDLLSDYRVENGHTLHLVARQPAESQASSGTSPGETNGPNASQVNEASTGAPRNRVGQISHSVVLGTFNVGDQTEAIVPDLTRVIGAVLNSIGVGGQNLSNVTGINPSTTTSSNPGQFPQGNETEGMHGNAGGQSQAGNQASSGQVFSSQQFQTLHQAGQVPLAASAIPIPSLNVPIPDSLNTLSEFMNRMEQNLAQNGYQTNLSSNNTGDQPRMDLPSNTQGLHTPEALSIVLRHAERLLSRHAVAALSHIAGRLEQEGGSSDLTLRGQIQSESVQVGFAMQHLGALLLELGRTILTLRMGQTPAESVVNAGPAVYISPSGPNPIMVQPFPLQTNPLFGGSVPTSNPLTSGPVGVGSAPRSVNIHIHTGASLPPIVSAVGARGSNGEGMLAERRNGAGSNDLGASRMLPVRNIIAAAVPSHPSGVPISSAAQPGPGIAVTQPPSDSVSLSSVLSEVNSQIRNLVGNMQGAHAVQSGQAESNVRSSSVGSGSSSSENEHPSTMAVNGGGESGVSLHACTPQIEGHEDSGSSSGSKDDSSCSVKGPWICSSGQTVKSEDVKVNAQGSSGNAKAVPLGLGLGSLERKKGKQLKPLAKNGDSGTTSSSINQDQQATRTQQLLQSLAARSSVVNRMTSNNPSTEQQSSTVGQVRDGSSGSQGSVGQADMANVMSQVLNSPALSGLLTGVSEQTGVGSPNVLRNMLQQFTQNPQMSNAMNQIAQQIDSQDVENMFAGLGGHGGGIDFSRMFQQMMPIVSRALVSGSTAPQSLSAMEPQPEPQYNQQNLSRDEHDEQNFQVDLQQVAQRIGHLDSPEDAFRALVENSFWSCGGSSGPQEFVDDLCSEEDLASEYVELLQQDIQRRLQDDSGQDRS